MLISRQHDKKRTERGKTLNCDQERIASWVHREAQDIYQSFLKVATRKLSNW